MEREILIAMMSLKRILAAETDFKVQSIESAGLMLKTLKLKTVGSNVELNKKKKKFKNLKIALILKKYPTILVALIRQPTERKKSWC